MRVGLKRLSVQIHDKLYILGCFFFFFLFVVVFYILVACETDTRIAHHVQKGIEKKIEQKGTNTYENTMKGMKT